MNLKAELDLSGKVIIKVQLDDDIRRIPIHNDAITYDELVLMMQRIFNGKLCASDDLTIKYKDEDGDLITINDNSDLSFAIQCSRLLKLIILINKPESRQENLKGNLNKGEIVVLKSQLRGIRDQVNKILDSLDVSPSANLAVTSKESQESEPISQPPKDAFVAKANSSEFDPLQEKKPEAVKEPSKSVQNTQEVEKRPQSVPVQQQPQQQVPSQTQQQQQQQQMSDYYGQTPNTDYTKYMNPQYGPQYSLPYESMRGYAQTYMTSAPHTMNYSSQQPQQQQVYAAAPSTEYPAPGNPYSKNYTQAPLQHNYIQPR